MKLRALIRDLDDLLPILGGFVIGVVALGAVPFARCASGGLEPSAAFRNACYALVALAAIAIGFGFCLAAAKRSRRRGG